MNWTAFNWTELNWTESNWIELNWSWNVEVKFDILCLKSNLQSSIFKNIVKISSSKTKLQEWSQTEGFLRLRQFPAFSLNHHACIIIDSIIWTLHDGYNTWRGDTYWSLMMDKCLRWHRLIEEVELLVVGPASFSDLDCIPHKHWHLAPFAPQVFLWVKGLKSINVWNGVCLPERASADLMLASSANGEGWLSVGPYE